jgi:hypothetical protein
VVASSPIRLSFAAFFRRRRACVSWKSHFSSAVVSIFSPGSLYIQFLVYFLAQSDLIPGARVQKFGLFMCSAMTLHDSSPQTLGSLGGMENVERLCRVLLRSCTLLGPVVRSPLP